MTLQERFSGCLIGGLLGDAIGAPVEAETAAYIRKTFGSVDDILKLERVEELLGAFWTVGRYTDDTQMTLPRRWCARMLDEDITPGSLAGLARQLAKSIAQRVLFH